MISLPHPYGNHRYHYDVSGESHTVFPDFSQKPLRVVHHCSYYELCNDAVRLGCYVAEPQYLHQRHSADFHSRYLYITHIEIMGTSVDLNPLYAERVTLMRGAFSLPTWPDMVT